MAKELDDRVLEVYKPPFYYDQHSGYICDSNHEVISDKWRQGVTRGRGWGRAYKMENYKIVHDEIGKHIAAALNQYWEAKNTSARDPDNEDPKPTGRVKHPMQPVVWSENNILRFQQNRVVDLMLKQLEKRGYTLNDLYPDLHREYDDEQIFDDIDQFNQLIGYSVSGIPLNDESIQDRAYEEAYKNGLLERPDTEQK